jgi:hypothetical protein
MAGRRHIEWLAAAGSTGIKITTKETDGSVFRAAKGQEYLSGVAKTFISGIAEIQKRYKPEIQPEQITALADGLLIQIQNNMERFLSPIASGFSSLAGDVFKLSISPFNDATAAVRRAEIRTHLKSLTPAERLEIFTQAVESGGDEIVQCFVENSQFFKLLDPVLIEKGKRQWLQRKDPTLAANYFETEAAGSVLESDFEKVITDLAVYATPQPERISGMLHNLPRPGWTHSETGDSRIINTGVMPSMLPPPSNKFAKSATERLAEANNKTQ